MKFKCSLLVFPLKGLSLNSTQSLCPQHCIIFTKSHPAKLFKEDGCEKPGSLVNRLLAGGWLGIELLNPQEKESIQSTQLEILPTGPIRDVFALSFLIFFPSLFG